MEATRLFNEKGTSEVSTNHICEALSMSPGNLYYHYRSKEEIIIAILKRMINSWDTAPPPQKPNMENLFLLFEQILTFLWEYRFIHREISSLYHQIEEFREIFKEVQARRMKEIKMVLQVYSAAGILRHMKPKEEERLIRIIWFFSLYWLSYLETEGKQITKKNVKESIEIMKSLLKPWMKESFDSAVSKKGKTGVKDKNLHSEFNTTDNDLVE